MAPELDPLPEAPRTILVAVAWPYASGSRHVGHLAGAYLPADIFARYQRLRGHRVLMVSGSDAHGTPITVRADAEGVSPRELVDRYHNEFVSEWETLQISWDLFTTTMTDTHRDTAQAIFRGLRDNGYIDKRTTDQFYDPVEGRFLPDRYIEGKCPYCDDDGARGDQCDACGRPLDATELINPRSAVSGGALELRPTEHHFLRLSAFEDRLNSWIDEKSHWRPFVRTWSLGMLNEGLKDRAVTRDLTWGVPIPDEPATSTKRIYVWFEAVIGYLSASIEWAQHQGTPDAWRDWWTEPTAESYYFIGKDNIPFHSIIWPAMLMGHGGLNLPTTIPANHYATFRGAKASASRGAGLTIGDALDRYEPDALRYALATLLPENADTPLSTDVIDTKIRTELISAWGNLTHRLLSMCWAWHGSTPPKGHRVQTDNALLSSCTERLVEAGALIDRVELRAALKTMFTAVHAANAYLSDQEPWRQRNSDPARADTILATALDAVATIAIGLEPFMPSTSRDLLASLGIFLTMNGADQWSPQSVPDGLALAEPQPRFTWNETVTETAAPQPSTTTILESAIEPDLIPVADMVITGDDLYNNPGYDHVRWDELDAIVARDSDGIDVIHQGFRQLRTTLGIGWRKRVPAPISLIERFQSADRISARNVVDFYNRISATTGLAIGLHDLDHVVGERVTLSLAAADIDFDRIGGRHDSVHAGEYVYSDDIGPICRLEVVQCGRTAATAHTARFLFLFQGNPATNPEYVTAVRNWTETTLREIALS